MQVVIRNQILNLFLKTSSILTRPDLRDIFNQLAVVSVCRKTLNGEKSRSAPELSEVAVKRKIGEYDKHGVYYFR